MGFSNGVSEPLTYPTGSDCGTCHEPITTSFPGAEYRGVLCSECGDPICNRCPQLPCEFRTCEKTLCRRCAVEVIDGFMCVEHSANAIDLDGKEQQAA